MERLIRKFWDNRSSVFKLNAYTYEANNANTPNKKNNNIVNDH